MQKPGNGMKATIPTLYNNVHNSRSCTVKTSHVVNLSCKTLPIATINLLSKGLGYAPTPEAPDI